MGFPEQLIPSDIKNQRLQPFSASPQGKEPIQTHPEGSKESENQLSSNQKEIQSGPKGILKQEGQPQCIKNQEDITIIEPLMFFNILCDIENNLFTVFNKLNNSEYTSGIVNLSEYSLTNTEISVLSKGLGFCPTPGAPDIGNIIQDLDDFKRKTRLQLFFSGTTEDPFEESIQSGGLFEHKFI